MLRKICFGLLWLLVLYVGIGVLASTIVGMKAGYGMTDTQQAFEAGRAAGRSVAWIKPYVLIGSALFVLWGAASGWLPGTKTRPVQPPRDVAVVAAPACFNPHEQAMLHVLRRQRDTWPMLRVVQALMSLALVGFAFWETTTPGSSATALVLLLVGVGVGSYTWRNWHGPIEATLLLRLLERTDAATTPDERSDP